MKSRSKSIRPLNIGDKKKRKRKMGREKKGVSIQKNMEKA
jgi:hypothetical protein